GGGLGDGQHARGVDSGNGGAALNEDSGDFLVENRHAVFLRLRRQMGNVSPEQIFRVFLRKSLEGNSHAYSRMRADGFAGDVDLFIIRLDFQGYNLPSG